MEMLAVDSLAPDSLAIDSLAEAPGMVLRQGIMLERPEEPFPVPAGESSEGVSWLVSILLLIFVVACFRYRKNSKFFSQMFQDAMEVRERHNAFDDTLRETTFIWLLNLLWIGSAGILLFGLLNPDWRAGALMPSHLKAIGVCIGMAAAYTFFLTVAYTVTGNLFSDSAKAGLWVKGYLSSQGLEAVALFPAALLLFCVPGLEPTLLLIAAIVFIVVKLLFIYKGYCIFFREIASWVLFLYYLCSLEIVPIVLTYVSARYLCSLL